MRDAQPIMGINPAMRRAWLTHNTGHALDESAHTAFAAEDARTNVENLVGAVQVPLGIAGPLRVNGTHARGSFCVPFATTEGTLVSTYQYGMRAITEAGGANACVLGDALDITPCFIVADTCDAIALADWLGDHLAELQAVAAESSAHGRLVSVRPHVFGRRVFVCRHVMSARPCERFYLRCNYSSDKKPAAINLFRPYGKEVAIDLTLPGEVVRSHLGVAICAALANGRFIEAHRQNRRRG